jgi:DNA-binding IclR family transcriptional regulator
MATDRTDGGVHSVARAIDILRVLGEASGDLTLGQIAERSGVPRSTVHRIVQTLREANFVAAGSGHGGLRLGPELARLAAISRAQMIPLVRPYLEWLSQKVDEGSSLAILDGSSVRFLDQAVAGHGLRAVSLVGSAFPAYCTANGKALLAALPTPTLDSVLPARMRPLTDHTIVRRAQLLAELDEIRATGIAYDREEHAVGVCAVGRVIRDAAGNLAAITVATPSSRFYGREEELVDALVETTRRVDAALRHAAP